MSIRFAQNVPTPPIAIDIADIPGRDEVIRAMALGIYPVDPVTRRRQEPGCGAIGHRLGLPAQGVFGGVGGRSDRARG